MGTATSHKDTRKRGPSPRTSLSMLRHGQHASGRSRNHPSRQNTNMLQSCKAHGFPHGGEQGELGSYTEVARTYQVHGGTQQQQAWRRQGKRRPDIKDAAVVRSARQLDTEENMEKGRTWRYGGTWRWPYRHLTTCKAICSAFIRSHNQRIQSDKIRSHNQ